MKKDFIIAYNDENGKGFDNLYPWLHDIGNDFEMALEHVDMLKNFGYKDVTLFYMNEDEYLEKIPWSFINERKIKI